MDRLRWFRDARFGLFLHWGAYALRGFEASWPLVRGQISYQDYAALADQFNPKRYDPVAWAEFARAAGMGYAVLTTKHHDGFALYDTQLSDYSAPRRAAGRDLVQPYVEAFRAAGLRVGFYFSLCDWHHPDYPVELADTRPGRTRPAQAVPAGAPASIGASPERWERYLEFMHGQVRELCTRYGTIDLLWFDGQWEHTAEEWRSRQLVSMIRELQPDIVINDRLAERSLGDYATPEQFVPVTLPDRPWETCMTINETWAYNPTDRAYKSSGELIATLAEVVSKGGNFLLNVGPTADGEIPPEFASRVRVVGKWMERNGESIHAAEPGLSSNAYYGPSTSRDDSLYLHVSALPPEGAIQARSLTQRVVDARVLATQHPLAFEQRRDGIRVHLPANLFDPLGTVIHLQLGPESS
ncbi:MAG TPA: alpha-L-fucosidase [Chloroflexota bacterium]|nr:alpha-L-fucosidase [Chloroflexota bacterium]